MCGGTMQWIGWMCDDISFWWLDVISWLYPVLEAWIILRLVTLNHSLFPMQGQAIYSKYFK
jgi:hypothetical protein